MTTNKHVLTWLDEMVALVKPDKVVWIDGSEEQLTALREESFKTGEMVPLNEELLPGCVLHHTAVNDVARVDQRDEGQADPHVRRLHEGPHHVRSALLHGPHRQPLQQGGH